MSEFNHQCALFDWARRPDVRRHLPDLDVMEASLNGVKLSKAQAGKAYAAGMLAGALDINLPVPRGVYHGMRIEMKYGKNKMSESQEWYAGRLIELGWKVVCCWDWEHAREEIIDYLTLKDMFPLPQASHKCDRCGFVTVTSANDDAWRDEFFKGL
jgi:hypothetical protein